MTEYSATADCFDVKTDELAIDNQIRTTRRATCVLCGGSGEYVYRGLSDRLFSAGGDWSLKQCTNDGCGLIWLDPMPLAEDIGKAYANYYTHTAQTASNGNSLLRRTYQRMKRGYLAGKYGYTQGSPESPAPLLGKLLYLFPLRRFAADASVRFLPAKPRGRLLDVGCGAGEWITVMRDFGWEVEGLDFDENAARVGRANGLKVHCGALEEQDFPSDSFDAVTLNHVIEHVPDPISTLTECARVLKKGGKLVLATPNNASLSHRVFKRDWRGLEPPRHLHIFSPSSMRRLLAMAGLKQIAIRPSIASSVVYESVQLRRGRTGAAATSEGNRPVHILAHAFNLAELCLVKWKPAAADCMIAMATKP